MPQGAHRRTWQDIEAEHGLPLKEVLNRLYDGTRSLREVGEILGVDHTSVRNWLLRCGIPLRKRAIYLRPDVDSTANPEHSR